MMYPEPVFDDAVDAEARKAQVEAERREAARLQVREAFPEITAFADLLQSKFGKVRIKWAVEGGQYVGNPPQAEIARYEKDGVQLQRMRIGDTDHTNRN